MIRYAVLAALVTAACAPPPTHAEEDEANAARYAAANDQRAAFAEQRAAERLVATREKNERLTLAADERERAAAAAAAEKKRIAEAELVADCDRDRTAREADEQRVVDSRRAYAVYDGWITDNCIWRDDSVPVTRVVQDARGEYHTYEGRSRGVDRVCKGPVPKKPRLLEIRPPASDRLWLCKELDIVASAVSREYWSR